MDEIRRKICSVIPREFIIDLEDMLRAEAVKAVSVVSKEFSLNKKRLRNLIGQTRFQIQDQGFEEVAQRHGGSIIKAGSLLNSRQKVFQSLARFEGPLGGIVLGFATMSEPRKLPRKNKSRLASVAMNGKLQPQLFEDETDLHPKDIFYSY